MMSAISAVASELADELTNARDAKQSVTAEFEELFGSVTDQLSYRQDKYINDPIAYHAFLISTVVELWDSSSTTRALLGKKHYESLAKEQRIELISAVDETLIRYAFEGLESYSGQVFKVDDVVINEEKGMGWVQVLMVSPVIPDINLDLLIKRSPQENWRAVDVRVKGITYVTIKKHGYREIFEEKGFDSLLVNLSVKNKEYFRVVCESVGMNKISDQKSKAPC
jgi:ABC-type transporter MlaC component